MNKVLFTTNYIESGKDLVDFWRANTRAKVFRFTWIRRHSMGLRFMKANIPEIELLEYPTWEEYTQKIQAGNYDIVGFSFYTSETPRIIKMIEFARANGVQTIWGGNYGVLTPGVEDYIDRTFVGYAVEEVAEALGKTIDRLKHPIAICYLGTTIGVKLMKHGILHSTMGCPLNCKYCQTSEFAPEARTIPLESIEDALIKYKELGVTEMYILDENFGIRKKHANKVAALLHKYNMHWYPNVRADILNANLDKWVSQGLSAANIGIESLSQTTLDSVHKHLNSDLAVNLVKSMNRRNLSTIIFYIIGFEFETKKSIIQDIKKLAALDSDIYQITIFSPSPDTELWDELSSKFGISVTDYKYYDNQHMIWAHPDITPEESADFLSQCYKAAYSPKKFFRTLIKGLKRFHAEFGLCGTITFGLKNFYNANVSRYLTKDHKRVI